MAPTRSARLSTTSILVNSLLCFVIAMQMLGVATSFWTLDFESDLVAASLLEGLSLPPSRVTLSTVVSVESYHESAVRLPSVLLEELLFRPPYMPPSSSPLA